MSDKHFQQRLQASYAQPDNAVAQLRVSQLGAEGWNDFVLTTLSPGFDIFVYAALTCQHTYFRLNCAEQGLQLASSEGGIEMVTDADWNLLGIRVDFTGQLAQGRADDALIDYIVGRMQQCPVSRNTREVADVQTRIVFR